MQRKNRIKTFLSRLEKKSSSSRIKQEVLGLVLIGIAVFLALSIVSYHPTDPSSFGEAQSSAVVQNWMGLLGAVLAAALFDWTFGYASLVFSLILGWLGVAILAQLRWKSVVKWAILLFLWGWWVAILLALPGAFRANGEATVYYPSGLLGGMVANIAVWYLGTVATVLVYVLVGMILSVLTFHISISDVFRKILGFLNGMWQQVREVAPRRISRSSSSETKRPRTTSPSRSAKAASRPSRSSPKPEEEKEAVPGDNEAAEPYSTPEIITSEKLESATQAVTPDPSPPGENAPGGRQIILEEEEKLLKEDLEIEEAVQEKELDYDAVIQNTLKHYQFPSVELLDESDQEQRVPREELMENAALLERTLQHFGVKATVKRVVEGPVITLYAVKPAEGVKISQIVRLADDLSLAMRAKGIRMIAPIPGEAAIGIEVPNRRPSTVHFKSIVRSEKFINAEGRLVLGLGKTISGEVFCADLAKMPHLLIAGATGAGKSVGINTMIASLLYRVPPSDLKFVLIDPKKLELSLYAKLKDHYLATVPELDEIVITHPQNAILVLRSVVNEMESRYDKLAQMGVRDIVAYNQKIEKLRERGDYSNNFRHLPYLVVIIDELADLILTAQKEVEEPIIRLAQMARAVGIHLIVATQRPSYDILTGLIKANFPARISYHVATRHDSKVILDMYGAEKLIGNGDMLFMPPGIGKPLRLQNPYLSTEEVERIIRHIRKQPKFPPYELKLVRARTKLGGGAAAALDRDELFEKAKKIVIQYQQGSISLLQRKLRIGYARAARLIDELEEEGIVGPGQGSKARDVLVSTLENDMNEGDDE